jgi:hypothetical protein
MPYQLGFASEQEYEDACILEGYAARKAALACNAIFTLAQAKALQLACDALPVAAVYLTEAAFEEYGWPADGLDESWLDDAGRATWEIFTAWRKA